MVSLIKDGHEISYIYKCCLMAMYVKASLVNPGQRG